MKYPQKIIITLLLFLLSIICLGCYQIDDNEVSHNDESYEKQDLLLFNTELNLTQEQIMSKIKADYLISNEGYLPDDELVVLITLKDDCLIDVYNDNYDNLYLSSFLNSQAANIELKKIQTKQELLINELTRENLIEEVSYRYNTILNGIAVKTRYQNMTLIENHDLVDYVIISETYNLLNNDEAVKNLVDVYSTGIFNSSSVSYTGIGTSVAVLDSGFDCSHSVFQNELDEDTLMLKKEDIENILQDTNAYSYDKNLSIDDVYYSNKIPFVFDYADKDADVFPYDSEHGTHVAGIIGGKDEEITGIAVNTQLVLMKVFADLKQGAESEDILAALEDAVKIGVDAINLSLGSSCGFSRERDKEHINEVYDRIYESGISIITAASNSYSSGFGGENGNTNKVTNPDSGTVGSPSTYNVSLSVASINGVLSKFLVDGNNHIIFFNESNAINGDPNDFFKELGITEGLKKTYEYVTVPGVGLEINYSLIDVEGKIALIRRGDITFEEKARNARNAGAIACIIYNNIEGDILMSMGKSDHVPTISISKEDGEMLASLDEGIIVVDYANQAGPFMSDFSSWGPTADLCIKPEITAHGGNIKSAIPGGDYDELSGTSMATPNLCGIVILIKQYLKEKYPTYTSKEISILTNQLLMSTAGIILNEQGNPYSPRKQGAGLASLYNAVTTDAYIKVDGIDRTKLELGDDKTRSGVYEMSFNLVNLSDNQLKYQLSLIGMSESTSTSDEEYVSEKSYLLSNHFTVTKMEGATIDNNIITLDAKQTASMTIVYVLSDNDKKYLDYAFPYGMYVEGFVKLTALDNGINLNVPFLAFYGDWTQAPIFDKTFYEVEVDAHNLAIDEENKLKADYYATTPYGSYYYNYMIKLGSYLYDIDEAMYDAIPATKEHIAISNYLGTIDGISTILTGLLRNCREMRYRIVNKTTGEEVWSLTEYNCNKAYSNGGSPVPYYNFIDLSTADLQLINNNVYEFTMFGLLDYDDGGIATNVRNTFSFDFTLDDEAPIIKSATYEKIYDKTLKKDRYYLTLNVYDNHYVQSIAPIIFTSNSTYTFLTKDPIPVYSEKGKDNLVRFEITDYLEDIYTDSIIPNALAFSIDDYALNSNIYLCELPGTRGDFKFTKDGTATSDDLMIKTAYVGEVIDITQYLSTNDKYVDSNKDYLKHLLWESSNEDIAVVKEGQVLCKGVGRVTVTTKEALNDKSATLIINVREKGDKSSENPVTTNYQESHIESLRFSSFETLFAYSRAAQTSEIGSTGSTNYISSKNGVISFYPGEKIKLNYDFNPWYAEENYVINYRSYNPSIVKVEEDGTLTALKKGSTTIVLEVEGSNIMATIRVNVKSEFVIEERTLIAYKGLGGEVVIPDDEGILYIGAYSFCLYDTDNTIKLTEEDYDANKIPSTNTSITKVTIPKGVISIEKYAFYNCPALEEVILPEKCTIIREYAFYNDLALTTINLEHVTTIGANCFNGCKVLKDIDLTKVYAIGYNGFKDCLSLESIDIRSLRNTGSGAFRGCTNLKEVVMGKDTKLSDRMFLESGIEEIDIYETQEIPLFAFARCSKLQKVVIHNDLLTIKHGAFLENPQLEEVQFFGSIREIEEQAFYQCESLVTMTLPNSAFSLGTYAFKGCLNLETLEFQKNTYITNNHGALFEDTKLHNFIIDSNNPYYSFNNEYLMNKEQDVIVLAKMDYPYGNLVISDDIKEIKEGALANALIDTLTITNKDLIIGDYAFVNTTITELTLPDTSGLKISKHAFNLCSELKTVINLDKVVFIDDYAFSNTTKLSEAIIGSNVEAMEGIFYRSGIETLTIGENSTFGFGAFQECEKLVSVNLGGNNHFGIAAFASDIQLKDIDLTKLDNEIENETFYKCLSLYEIHITSEIIGKYAFADCGTLTKVQMENVREIKEGAFSKYEEDSTPVQIVNLVLPNTLKIIGDGAFLGCEKLKVVTIPESIEEIGDFGFAACLSLVEINLPETLTTIPKYCFYKAGYSAGNPYEEVELKVDLSHITNFKEYCFYQATYLTNTDLDEARIIEEASFAETHLKGNLLCPNLTYIGDYAFKEASMETLVAPNLNHLGYAAFEDCSSLKEFIFFDDLEFIDSLVFVGCSNLTNYYYYPHRDINNLTELDRANLMTTHILNDYALLNESVLYIYLPNGKLQLQSIPTNLNVNTIKVLEDTYRIDTYAGSENPNVKSISLPSSLKLIGNFAFYEYNSLERVEFKSSVAPTLESYYVSSAKLNEDDKQYELLHNQYDIFELELCYYNFIDLVGKIEPIEMILPNNEELDGYDNLIYLAYFGNYQEASRTTNISKSKELVSFLEDVEIIMSLDEILIQHEELIARAKTTINKIKDSLANFGITEEVWNNYIKIVDDAMDTINQIKIKNAKQLVKDAYFLISQLPDSYSKDIDNQLIEISNIIKELNQDEKALLKTSHYEQLMKDYNEAKNREDSNPVIVGPEVATKANFFKRYGFLFVIGLILIIIGIYLSLVIRRHKKGGKQ